MAAKIYTWADIEAAVASIQVAMHLRGWMPDYVVGYRAGGAIPATMLASRLGVPVHYVDREETNCWMSEDACGHGLKKDEPRKKILIITDYNRTGDDLEWLKNDWASSSVHHGAWDEVWTKTTRIAALLDNVNSNVALDYIWREVEAGTTPELNPNRDVDHVFPWDVRAALAQLG